MYVQLNRHILLCSHQAYAVGTALANGESADAARPFGAGSEIWGTDTTDDSHQLEATCLDQEAPFQNNVKWDCGAAPLAFGLFGPRGTLRHSLTRLFQVTRSCR